jgi:hypothetical protein
VRPYSAIKIISLRANATPDEGFKREFTYLIANFLIQKVPESVGDRRPRILSTGWKACASIAKRVRKGASYAPLLLSVGLASDRSFRIN